MQTERNFGLITSKEEIDSFAGNFKALVGQAKIFVRTDTEFVTLAEIELWAKQRNITGIFCNRQDVLEKLVLHVGRKKPSITNYEGSYFKRNDIEWVIINSLSHLVKVPYAPFLFKRFCSKLLAPETWPTVPEFNYSLYDEATIEATYQEFATASVIAIDIETDPTRRITCVGYTALFAGAGVFRTKTLVVPLHDLMQLAWIRKLNALPSPKIFQNGKYDCAYLSRYNAVPVNYIFDTANAMHCWYSELPKDLGSIQAFFVRSAAYWKDLSQTGNLADDYLYCGKDTWATALAFVFWLLEAPEWAKRNYLMEFPVVYPSHFCELLGIRLDAEALRRARTSYSETLAKKQQSLNTILGCEFNTASTPQKQRLLTILGHRALLPSTDEQTLNKASFLDPLSGRILSRVIEIQKDRKLLSTYLWDQDNEQSRKDFSGRILYSINPHATDTGRNASAESHFWCGLQIQNVPRGNAVKQIFMADPDFLFGECDLEQAESRDTAYISGCERLIRAVSGTRDFHSVNASSFFGKPYEAIYDDEKRKTLDKSLRDLSKRVNHGANYNMGESVLVTTMGLKKVYEAAKLLNLPRSWSALQIAKHLLSCFHATYKEISSVYYPWVVSNVLKNKMLVGATGWTRYCFGNPTKSKQVLNAYVAHPPQSLNAMVLNKAFVRVFVDLQMHPEHSKNFRLLAQIHDSILFQYRRGHEYLCQEVKKRMEIPIEVVGADGVKRSFTVPAAIKTSPNATHWNLTEE
jgi:DNA polymerase I-like protein with 3'-5' exonuclease and polymerase domains